MLKPVTIIGGGLAGLTLGIGLRQRGVPVILWEAGHYPRHRVCGEFISGRGQQALRWLGLWSALLDAGAIFAGTARFFFGGSSLPARRLPAPALCLSRFDLDALLADRFRDFGGDLRVGQRWRGDPLEEGIVCACGRRLRPQEKGWRWFGLKVHAREAALDADLEMHLVPNGYVGLCRLPRGEVNVCGLFRRPAFGAETAAPRPALLRGQPGSSLCKRLARAAFDQNSWCAVAGLGLSPQRAAACTECRIGDALTMTPPVTGNGMSMAFESAEIAIEPLARYSRGESSWPALQQTIASGCDRAFASRLAWARWLQSMMFSPVVHSRLGTLPFRSEWLWRTLFSRTR